MILTCENQSFRNGKTHHDIDNASTYIWHKFLTTIVIISRIKTWLELNVNRLY